MVQFLHPETAKILQFLDPEIVEMDKKKSGSRNRRKGAISGSINRRKGRQILYRLTTFLCGWVGGVMCLARLTEIKLTKPASRA